MQKVSKQSKGLDQRNASMEEEQETFDTEKDCQQVVVIDKQHKAKVNTKKNPKKKASEIRYIYSYLNIMC